MKTYRVFCLSVQSNSVGELAEYEMFFDVENIELAVQCAYAELERSGHKDGDYEIVSVRRV